MAHLLYRRCAKGAFSYVVLFRNGVRPKDGYR